MSEPKVVCEFWTEDAGVYFRLTTEGRMVFHDTAEGEWPGTPIFSARIADFRLHRLAGAVGDTLQARVQELEDTKSEREKFRLALIGANKSCKRRGEEIKTLQARVQELENALRDEVGDDYVDECERAKAKITRLREAAIHNELERTTCRLCDEEWDEWDEPAHDPECPLKEKP